MPKLTEIAVVGGGVVGCAAMVAPMLTDWLVHGHAHPFSPMIGLERVLPSAVTP
jgi:hypothetical protein